MECGCIYFQKIAQIKLKFLLLTDILQIPFSLIFCCTSQINIQYVLVLAHEINTRIRKLLPLNALHIFFFQ